jgi:type VI secretion system VasD/TssJ family lipoprotein
MTHRSSLLFPVVLLVGLLLTGCFGSPELQMQVQGNDQMNGGGNPAVVRIYQLSGESSFTRASAADFWADDLGQLSGELVGPPQDLTIYPDEARTLTLEPSDDAQFIGFAADLRNPTQDQWRAVHPVSELADKEITIMVLSDRLDVRF